MNKKRIIGIVLTILGGLGFIVSAVKIHYALIELVKQQEIERQMYGSVEPIGNIATLYFGTAFFSFIVLIVGIVFLIMSRKKKPEQN